MFDDVIRQIENLERGIEIRVPIAADAEGYLDKECPAERCQFQFKVLEDDWREKFRDEEVFCPYCGHASPADTWFTTEQVEHAKEQALGQVSGIIGEALRRDAANFNRRQPRGGFVTMSMDVRGSRQQRAIISAPSAEEFELKITCEVCSSRFSVVGSAFFCPCCGDSSAERLFDQALTKTRAKTDSVGIIELQLAASLGRDEARLVARSLTETALVDCVVALQRLAEQLYRRLPNTGPPAMNVFQRIDDGSNLWRAAVGHGYEAWLTDHELHEVKTLFERRHLLSHTDGIVDDRYLARTGDHSYQRGQRIIIKEHDVAKLTELVGRLGQGLKTDAPRTP